MFPATSTTLMALFQNFGMITISILIKQAMARLRLFLRLKIEGR